MGVLQNAVDGLEQAAQEVSGIDFSEEKEDVAGALQGLASTLSLISTALENAANAFRQTFAPEPGEVGGGAPAAADTEEVDGEAEAD